MRLLSLSGEAPFETIGWYGRGWYRRGWYGQFGWTPVYSAVCDQPCTTRLAPGGYHLALAKYGGPAVPAPEPIVISGPSTIHGDYTDRSGLRTASWIVGVAGAVGGLLLVVASAQSENVCDAYGDCYTHETASGPLLAAGVGVLLASAIVSTVLVFQRDEAHITVEPLTLPSSRATGRSPLADLGGVARPQGAALSLHSPSGVSFRFLSSMFGVFKNRRRAALRREPLTVAERAIVKQNVRSSPPSMTKTARNSRGSSGSFWPRSRSKDAVGSS